MKYYFRLVTFLFCISAFSPCRSQVLHGYLPAQWIIPSGIDPHAYGIYHFRKSFEVNEVPASFIIHVSADQRFRLFVNGESIGIGPARSDPQHWMYDTYDIASHLVKGKNTIAAMVWYLGQHAPYAQMTVQAGFFLQGNSENEKMVNTDATWKSWINKAYSPVVNDIRKLQTYIVVGDGDQVDAALYPWGWEENNFNDSKWPQAGRTWFGAKTRGFGSDGNWMLVPRSIPEMADYPIRLNSIKRIDGFSTTISNNFLEGKAPFTIPANKKVTILFDQSHLTNAYPHLMVSKGKASKIKISYAEALMNDKREKGHRDSINGRKVIGFDDIFIPDGGMNRLFYPLWFRTYRYLQLDIETKKEPLIIEDLYGRFTGYPFEEKASIHTDQSNLKSIWNTGWRTAQLCAGETYFDCPYYEQLQYTGDTRIQSLISLYVTGDDRLMKKAINDYNNSRIYEGLTQSRYPCNDMQIIPPFSLYWVSMIYDYWMHRTDDEWIKSLLNGVRDVLDWHEQRLASNGMNGYLPWWNFVDWVWDAGTPRGREGNSSILSLQYVYTLQQAEKLFRNFDRGHDADHCAALARSISKAVLDQCWDTKKQLLADHPTKENFSQHANIWALLTNTIPGETQETVFNNLLNDTSIVQATFYFKFYLFECLKKMNAGDKFLPLLEPWHKMINYGLTTFAEKPEPVRSDCHAWSASPNYQLLSIVGGINPASSGFKTVSIKPYLGALKNVDCTMPHPNGMIKAKYQVLNQVLNADLELPAATSGTFTWKNIIYPLHAGANHYAITN